MNSWIFNGMSWRSWNFVDLRCFVVESMKMSQNIWKYEFEYENIWFWLIENDWMIDLISTDFNLNDLISTQMIQLIWTQLRWTTSSHLNSIIFIKSFWLTEFQFRWFDWVENFIKADFWLEWLNDWISWVVIHSGQMIFILNDLMVNLNEIHLSTHFNLKNLSWCVQDSVWKISDEAALLLSMKSLTLCSTVGG